MKRHSPALFLLLSLVFLAVVASRSDKSKSDPSCVCILDVPHVQPPQMATPPSELATPPPPMLTPTITPAPDSWPSMSAEQRLADLRSRRSADVGHDLSAKGMKLGDAVHIRIFKESSELELWLATTAAGAFRHYKTWPIAAYSGSLGPKLREGDGQAPEGFYTVVKQRMNPMSNYHLSFNLGYPNAYDAAHGRTGSFLMVHGKDVSIGCYAMTDPVIEEIYLIALAAFEAGQAEFAVHCFPFHMTEARMDAAHNEAGEWLDFWRELHAGWAAFEASKRVPKILVDKGRYVVSLAQ